MFLKKKTFLRKHTNLQQWRGGTIARKLAPAHYLVTAKICTNGKIWRFTQPSSPTKIKGGCLEGKPTHFLAKKTFWTYFHLSIVIEGGCFGQRRQVERRKSSGKWELHNSSSPSSALSPLATGSHLFFSGFRPSCPPMVMAAPSPSPTLTITYHHHHHHHHLRSPSTSRFHVRTCDQKLTTRSPSLGCFIKATPHPPSILQKATSDGYILQFTV